MNTDERRIENFQSESVTRTDRISEIEGKAAKGSGERAGQRASFKICVNPWLTSSHRRNHFQFYRNRRRQCTDLDRSTSWIRLARAGKIFCVDSVVDWKIFFHVYEKDSDIDDVLPRCAGVFQDKPHVFKDSATLRFNVVTNNVAGGIERDAGNFLTATFARPNAREKQQIAYSLRMRKRAHWFRRTFALECFAHPRGAYFSNFG